MVHSRKTLICGHLYFAQIARELRCFTKHAPGECLAHSAVIVSSLLCAVEALMEQAPKRARTKRSWFPLIIALGWHLCFLFFR